MYYIIIDSLQLVEINDYNFYFLQMGGELDGFIY